MKKHDIVLMPFPGDDLRVGKLRPALCLTGELGRLRHVVLAYITSRIPTDLRDSDLVLDASGTDFRQTGLDVTSAVRLHRLSTVRIEVIEHRLGQLPASLAPEVSAKIKALFD